MNRTVFKYTEQSSDDVKIFHLVGNLLGEHDSRELCSRIKGLIEEDRKNFVINLKNVKWINSNGIGILLACLVSSRNKGGDVRFANVHDAAMRYFQITKLETVIDMFDTIDEAVKSYHS